MSDDTPPVKSPRTGTLYWLPVILDADTLDGTDTLLLLALADHVDGHDECYVGMARLSSRARCSYSTTRRRLAAMESAGMLVRTRRRRDDGNLSVYDYRLLREAFGQPALILSGDTEPPLFDQRSPSLTQVDDDQRSPGWTMTSAHQGERAEPPRSEPPRDEVLLTSLRESALDAIADKVTATERERRDGTDHAITNKRVYRNTIRANAEDDFGDLLDAWLNDNPGLEADELATLVLSGDFPPCRECSGSTWLTAGDGVVESCKCAGERWVS